MEMQKSRIITYRLLRVNVGYFKGLFIGFFERFANNKRPRGYWKEKKYLELVYLQCLESEMELDLTTDSPPLLLSCALPLLVGFTVSKHTISSKQSSNPSLLRTFATWASFAFENICFNHNRYTHYTNIIIQSVYDHEGSCLLQCYRSMCNLQLSEQASYAKDSSEHGHALKVHKVISHVQNC